MPVASRFDYVDHRLDALGVGKGCARLKLAANGAAPSVSATICVNQRSKSSRVRQFAVGNAPMIPALQLAMTRSGPETKNIGAAIIGNRRAAVNSLGRRCIGSPNGRKTAPRLASDRRENVENLHSSENAPSRA